MYFLTKTYLREKPKSHLYFLTLPKRFYNLFSCTLSCFLFLFFFIFSTSLSLVFIVVGVSLKDFFREIGRIRNKRKKI